MEVSPGQPKTDAANWWYTMTFGVASVYRVNLSLASHSTRLLEKLVARTI